MHRIRVAMYNWFADIFLNNANYSKVFSHYLSKICKVYYKVKSESAIQLVISLLLLSNLNLYTTLYSPKNIWIFLFSK